VAATARRLMSRLDEDLNPTQEMGEEEVSVGDITEVGGCVQ
jgi:hypothetical protein